MTFMEGYTRQPETAERVIAAIREAVYTFPTMRLGQVIEIALAADANAPHDLFQVHDENLIAALTVYMKEHA